jgi:hypothetical protein
VSRSDSEAVRAFLDEVEPGAHAVTEGDECELRWLVVGPPAGPYFSRISAERDEQSARKLAERWAKQTNATFDIRRSL